jgi:outer membrane protein
VTLTETTHRHRATALTSIQDRFESGAATRLEVVQAERDLLESALEAVNARVEYQIALVRFYRAEGTLLQRRGISVD